MVPGRRADESTVVRRVATHEHSTIIDYHRLRVGGMRLDLNLEARKEVDDPTRERQRPDIHATYTSSKQLPGRGFEARVAVDGISWREDPETNKSVKRQKGSPANRLPIAASS